MKDQYGNDIPKDLVLIPNIEELDEYQIRLVDNATWYEQDKFIMVSFTEVNELSEDNPEDVGIFLTEGKIFKIDHVLHRYNDNGFYYA